MNKNILSMSLGAILIGFSPIVTKAVTLHPTTIGFYRFFFGVIIMGLVVVGSKEKINWQNLKKAAPYFALSGLFFAIDLWFWHRSIIYIGAGIATVLANTQVLYLALFERLILKQKSLWYLYPSMMVAVAGITLSSFPFFHHFKWDQSSAGIVWGLMTGITYAIITLFLRKGLSIYQGKGVTPLLTVSFFACLAAFFLAVVEGEVKWVQGPDFYYMILYGMGIHFGGWYLISKSINSIALVLAGLLLLLQPIFATLFGHILYDESLSFIQMMGLVLALVGIYFSSVAKKQRPAN